MGPISLDREQLDTLLKAERILHDILPQIDDLEACGADCVMMRRDALATADQIRTLRDKFGRNTPS